jgi:hypothetical protein
MHGSMYITFLECLETLDRLIVEENYLLEQIFNMDENSLFWKRVPERTIIHKESKSMPGFKVCVRTLHDFRIKTKLPNDAFLCTYPRR